MVVTSDRFMKQHKRSHWKPCCALWAYKWNKDHCTRTDKEKKTRDKVVRKHWLSTKNIHIQTMCQTLAVNQRNERKSNEKGWVFTANNVQLLDSSQPPLCHGSHQRQRGVRRNGAAGALEGASPRRCLRAPCQRSHGGRSWSFHRKILSSQAIWHRCRQFHRPHLGAVLAWSRLDPLTPGWTWGPATGSTGPILVEDYEVVGLRLVLDQAEVFPAQTLIVWGKGVKRDKFLIALIWSAYPWIRGFQCILQVSSPPTSSNYSNNLKNTKADRRLCASNITPAILLLCPKCSKLPWNLPTVLCANAAIFAAVFATNYLESYPILFKLPHLFSVQLHSPNITLLLTVDIFHQIPTFNG